MDRWLWHVICLNFVSYGQAPHVDLLQPLASIVRRPSTFGTDGDALIVLDDDEALRLAREVMTSQPRRDAAQAGQVGPELPRATDLREIS